MESPLFLGRAFDLSGERYRLLSETNLFRLIGTHVWTTQFIFNTSSRDRLSEPGHFALAYTKRLWISVLPNLPYR